MRIEVKERQTLLDIALATAGTVEAAIEIAEANGLSLTDELGDGRELEVPDRVAPGGNTADARVVRRYGAQGVEPATEASAEERAACAYGGIGFMGVEIDFEVS